VADVAALVEQRPCVLVGHSFGGIVALAAAAADTTSRVASVAVYEPPAAWLTGARPSRVDARDPAAAAEAFMISQIGEAAWRRIGEPVRTSRRAEGPAMLADLAMAGAGPPFDPADVLVPVSVARGGSTQRFVASTDALAAVLPDARLVDFDGVGHGAHLSHPDAFASWIIETVQALEG
jgi:pimeloyl-ACP methyl ester carboxylesterase